MLHLRDHKNTQDDITEVKSLLEAVRNNYGMTSMNAAALNGHLETVKLLLDRGVDSTVPDKNGSTPVNTAASRGHLEVVKLLLDRGGNASDDRTVRLRDQMTGTLHSTLEDRTSSARKQTSPSGKAQLRQSSKKSDLFPLERYLNESPRQEPWPASVESENLQIYSGQQNTLDQNQTSKGPAHSTDSPRSRSTFEPSVRYKPSKSDGSLIGIEENEQKRSIPKDQLRGATKLAELASSPPDFDVRSAPAMFIFKTDSK